MRPKALAASSILIATASAQLVLPFFNTKPNENTIRKPAQNQQHPIMDPNNAPNIQLPSDTNPNSDNKHPPPPPPTGDVILSDVIGSQKQLNIFAGFTRDVLTVSTRLDASNQNTTVLAPSNAAIQSLPRKPWEDAKEYAELGAEAYAGQAGEGRASKNLQRFTEAHVVPLSPWGEGEKVRSLGGGEVWWEKREEGVVVMPGEVGVERVVSRVANGEVWLLRGVLNYAS